MRVIKINKNKIEKEQLDLVADYLLSGKVVVLPTDTIYGLSCVVGDEGAVEKIYRIKNRPKEKSFLVLIKSYCMLHDYFHVSAKQEKYIRSIWPKTTREAHDFSQKSKLRPTTFVLNERKELIKNLSTTHEGIGVRLPKNELLIKIIKKVNQPIVSTSLNVSEKAVIGELSLIQKNFKILPDLVVDQGINKIQKPSRLIDIRDMENIRVIR